MRRAVMVGTVLVAGWLLAGFVPSAQAHAGEPAPWRALDTSTAGVQTTSANSKIVDAHTADATWKAGQAASSGGTSIENANLDLPVVAGDKVEVSYELRDGASPAAGAVRLFVYNKADANTFTEAPTQFVYVGGDGPATGKLTVEVSWSGTLGTAGLVYDTSNGGVPGTVRFTNLTVAGDLVSFVEPQVEPTASPSASPSPSASASTSAPASSSQPPAAGGLPVTGVDSGDLLRGSVVLLVGGGLILFVGSRIKRQESEASK